jgi:hypothetical protein
LVGIFFFSPGLEFVPFDELAFLFVDDLVIARELEELGRLFADCDDFSGVSWAVSWSSLRSFSFSKLI